MFRSKWYLFIPLLAMSANAAVLLNETFDSNLNTQTNTAPTGWTQTSGTVDTVRNGSFGLICAGNAGSCVDLDGSTLDAAEFSYGTLFTLNPGLQYTLSYSLSGSHRGDTNEVTVTFGGVTQTQTMLSSDPFTVFTLTVIPASTLTNQKITFQNAGGDNLGALLDNVKLESAEIVTSSVPEPGTGTLILAAIGLLPILRRRLR